MTALEQLLDTIKNSYSLDQIAETFIEDVEGRADSICLAIRNNPQNALSDEQLAFLNQILTHAELAAFGALNTADEHEIA